LRLTLLFRAVRFKFGVMGLVSARSAIKREQSEVTCDQQQNADRAHHFPSEWFRLQPQQHQSDWW
jgi:hypothetical protein